MLDKVFCSYYVPCMCSVFVFIVSTPDHTRFQTGMTEDLVQHIWQLRDSESPPAPSWETASKLVWYKRFKSQGEAETYLARITRWPHAWQARLAKSDNKTMQDLWSELAGQPSIRLSPSFETHTQSGASPYPVLRLAERDIPTPPPPVQADPILIRQRAS